MGFQVKNHVTQRSQKQHQSNTTSKRNKKDEHRKAIQYCSNMQGNVQSLEHPVNNLYDGALGSLSYQSIRVAAHSVDNIHTVINRHSNRIVGALMSEKAMAICRRHCALTV